MMPIAFKIEPTNTKTATTPNTAAVRRAEARRIAKVDVALEVAAIDLMPDITVRQHPRLNLRRRLKTMVGRR